MATDQTPPNVKFLGIVGLVSVLIFIGLSFVLRSYFVWTTGEERQRKVLGVQSSQLRDYRAVQAETTRGVERAIRRLADAGVGLPAPVETNSVDAVEGWNQAPNKRAAAAAKIAMEAEALRGGVSGGTADAGADASPSAGGRRP